MSHYAKNKKWKHKVYFNATMNSGLRIKGKSERRQRPEYNGKKRHKDKNKHESNKSRHSDKNLFPLPLFLSNYNAKDSSA